MSTYTCSGIFNLIRFFNVWSVSIPGKSNSLQKTGAKKEELECRFVRLCVYISTLSKCLLSVYSMVTVSTYNWMDWFDRIYFPYHAHIMLASAFDRCMCACVRCALFHSFGVYVVRVLPTLTFRIGEGVESTNSYNFVFLLLNNVGSYFLKQNFQCVSFLFNWNHILHAKMFKIFLN